MFEVYFKMNVGSVSKNLSIISAKVLRLRICNYLYLYLMNQKSSYEKLAIKLFPDCAKLFTLIYSFWRLALVTRCWECECLLFFVFNLFFIYQILSNTIKQKRKEKAGKWEVPLPKVKCSFKNDVLLCFIVILELLEKVKRERQRKYFHFFRWF